MFYKKIKLFWFIGGREAINYGFPRWSTFNFEKCVSGGKNSRNYSISSTNDDKRIF